ncbi:leucine zipper protein 1-like [Scleropages formosus]|uniref:Leucine zipper protein 1 n=1 Tax=Scleropages formosus TaxID=113540 RepID=A0A0P7Z802_SCLFO|nr:leucine zipper protein 1 [Scleropages formosus]XP_018587518.2 leucine zipper protein 1 [Scleropages formosus]XP_018587526.2 leucine zipper protein 1 [Scleropages formosus]XP_018587533.2 leucine zipper protein 1 [Scleropages formosus]XP_018587541.2 leucine zipper protein 1 [Scleropages formosus]XP_018587550.2 leucine zipper protein 1 [Scleropages formosus]KPP76867.1 leucine zipper protein 1-like [Scleropages formosus]
MTDYKDTTNRHLRHKLQSLSRRLDELEEAASKLQKSEDELLDVQDKIIQAEGSNSPLLNDVDVLRKRVLKIEGKDEEVRKAEDLCRLVREKLEQEETLTKDLKKEIERLQKRMTELEKLEEAFSKCKSDCTQLCLSLNEEKNLTKKLSSELEGLKVRMKEVDSSECRLDKTEQALATELEKLKLLTQNFVSERKRLLEKQREDEKLIFELTEKLERNNHINSADQSRNASNLQERPTETGDPRIEDDLSPGLTSKLGPRKKSFDLLKISDDVGLRNKSENEKNRSDGQEDNKLKDLSQEIERLKNRLKQLELVEEDLKKTESKHEDLLQKFQRERNRSRALNDQVEQLKIQLCMDTGNSATTEGRVLENGKAENEEINVRGGFRQEKPRHRGIAAESSTSRCKTREVSPQQGRETKVKNKDLEESSPKSTRRPLSPAHSKSRRGLKMNPSTAADVGLKEKGKMGEERTPGSVTSGGTSIGENKKPSVLSRYPPAANDQKSWKSSVKSSETDKKSRVEKPTKNTSSDPEPSNLDALVDNSNKATNASLLEKDNELLDQSQGPLVMSSLSKANGSYTAYRSRVSPLLPCDQGSEGHSSASETESTGSRRSVGELESMPDVTASGRTTVPKYSRYMRLQDSHSGGSSTRSSFEEEQIKPLVAENSSQEPTHTPSGIEIRRVCSPREALRSKAVIKPAIVEIDRKEVMISGGGVEPLPPNGKPKISTKPIVTSKVTSSITIYPSDPSSSRTSSRSSSVSSEPLKERHTSTSNIVITSSEHHGSVSIPYEISIPKSEITLRPALDANDAEEPACVERQLSQSSFAIKSPEMTTVADVSNDTESSFENSSHSTVIGWRSHHGSRDDCLPETRSVTVRSTWRNKVAASVDESGRSTRLDGSEDEAESATTWRAYRATTILDAEELPAATAAVVTRSSRPSPAEEYMRRISSVTSREPPEPVRRSRSSLSPTEDLKKVVAHEPVSAQELQPWNRAQSPAVDDMGASPLHSWRKQAPAEPSSSNWVSRTETTGRKTASKPELWRGQPGRMEGRGSGGRPWSHRHSDN